MTLKWRRRAQRPAVWLFLALLAACGGGAGTIAVLQIVTPLGGDWVEDNSVEKVDFNANPNAVVLFESSLNVTAAVTTADDICGGGFVLAGTDVDVEGTLDNGDLVLHLPGDPNTCLEGAFTDLITLEAGPPGQPTRLYKNSRVDVQMALGLWVSGSNNPLKLKFTRPDSVDNNVNTEVVQGCDVSAITVVKFIGVMHGFDTNTNSKPLIPELRSDDNNDFLLFSQIVFEDGATLKLLDSLGNPVTLHREEDTTTTCP